MRIDYLNAQADYAMRSGRLQSAGRASNPVSVSGTNTATSAKMPYAVLTFAGKNKNAIAHVVYELPPLMKVGGVGTVAHDYLNMANWLSDSLKAEGLDGSQAHADFFMPYYNGKIEFDPITGAATDKVSIRKIGDKPVFIHPDTLKKFSMDEIAKKPGELYFELEEAANATIPWSLNPNEPVAAYKVKGLNIPQKNVDVYMIYTKGTAAMEKAYAESSAYSSESKIIARGLEGSPNALFAKGLVRTMPALGKDFETVICSDSQTAFVPEFAAREALSGNDYYQGLKVSGILHNMGAGYCGEMSAKQAFMSLAESPEQIKAVLDDPKYFEALKKGAEEQYFKQFIPEMLDANGTANSNMIFMKHLKDGYLTHIDTVSEGYAEAAANNPNVTPLHPVWKEMYAQGRAGGILNGFEDPNVSAFKPVNLKGYNSEQVIEGADGAKRVFKALKVFPSKDEITFDSMRETKRLNKINVLSRLDGTIKEGSNLIVTGDAKRGYKQYGFIDPKFVKMLENGEDVTMFDFVGRGDAQKGTTISLNAFRKFAKTPEGKNSVLVMGVGLTPGLDETKKIMGVLEGILADPDLKGRVAFLDGWGPSYAWYSASDATLASSTFAPCELIDLEGPKYFSTAIVTNTQGLAQKNYDPRNPAEALKATAYKTQHEFMMPDSVIDRFVKGFGQGDNSVAGELRKEFSLVDEEAFENFGTGYKKLLDKFKKQLAGRADDAHLDEAANIALRKSDEYKKLVIKLKEDILTDEMADAIKARVADTDNETARTIFENQLALDTTWTGNRMLHPGEHPLSSWELYKTRHIDPAPGVPKGSILAADTFTSFTGKQKEAGGFLSGVTGHIKDKRVAFVVAGIAAVAAAAGLLLYNSNKKAKKNDIKNMPQSASAPAPALEAVPQSISPAAPSAAVMPVTPIQPAVSQPYTAAAPINPAQNKFADYFNKAQAAAVAQ